MSSYKPALAWVSPTDIPSSVASYVSGLILPYFREEFDVTEVCDEVTYGRFDPSAYDIVFCNIENHPKASFALASLPFATFAYIHDLHFDGRQIALEKFANCRAMYFSSLTDLRRILHSKKLSPSVEVSLLPYPVNVEVLPITSVSSADIEGERNKIFKVVLLATPGLEYRAEKILRALSAQAQGVELHWMLNASEREYAEELCNHFGFKEAVYYSPRDLNAWQRICRDGDVVVIPKVSALMDLGPVLPLALASGTPVVVSDFGDAGELSDRIVKKVPVGYREEEHFEQAVFSSRTKLNHRNLAGLDFVRETHEAGFVSQQLLNDVLKHTKKTPLEKKGSLM